MDLIVHIVSQADWQAVQSLDEYQAISLKEEGFIHFSRPEQVIGTANLYYLGQQDLLLLWVDRQKVVSDLRWESSHGEIYPHLYGPLNIDAIVRIDAFPPDADGVFRDLPQGR
jgi:uncharacterized protein (DUF952 family)